VRQHLHPGRQDIDRIVDAADEQQARLQDERHLRPALHVQQRQDRGEHPDADEAERAEQHERDGGAGVCCRQVQLREEQDQRDEDDRSVDEAVDHRVQHGSEQLRRAPDGRHHRVLERAFPSLDGDRFRDPAEHDRQVVPEDRPDHQGQQQLFAALGCTDE
jgi:hypothetical protein